jgi:probable HAF family extracellular repeat protein
MRRIIGTIGATLAIVAVMATSAGPASAAGHDAPEFGFDVSAQRAAHVSVAGSTAARATQGRRALSQTFGLASGLGSDPELNSRGNAGQPANPSGGFIYRTGGYTPLDSLDGLITAHVGINNRGQTAGAYFRSELDPGGFLRSRRGDYTRVDVAPGPSTLPVDINDRGTIVGLSGDAVTGEAGAFLRRPNGAVAAVEVPGAQSTGPFGVNNRGAVVGTYRDAGGVNQAFVMQRGKVTTIVPPDTPADPAASQTVATDINDRGQVVGCYADANGTYHGFRYDEGRFTRIDPPGGADVPKYATTCPFGINNRGQVVGQYVDAAGVLHGYLWERGRGFDTIDPPCGAPVVGPAGDRGTVAADINDRGEILLPIPGGLYKARPATIGG